MRNVPGDQANRRDRSKIHGSAFLGMNFHRGHEALSNFGRRLRMAKVWKDLGSGFDQSAPKALAPIIGAGINRLNGAVFYMHARNWLSFYQKLDSSPSTMIIHEAKSTCLQTECFDTREAQDFGGVNGS